MLACVGGGDAEKEYLKRMEARRQSRQTQRSEAKDERARAYQEKEREKVTNEHWKERKVKLKPVSALLCSRMQFIVTLTSLSPSSSFYANNVLNQMEKFREMIGLVPGQKIEIRKRD